MEKYETLGKRFWASILDSIIIMLIQGIGVFITVFVGASATLSNVASVTTGLVAVFYIILMHYYYGQTVGKMAAKVKVLDDSESSINFGQAVLRSLPQLFPVMFAVSFSTAGDTDSEALWGGLISGLTVIFEIADIIVCLSNDKRRALHDFIAGTIVVRTDV